MLRFLCFISLLPLLLMAQKETSQWYFGQYCGVNFLTNPPSSINNGSISAIEGCASISDAAGNLLFYTNGLLVWNSAHAVMPNGLGGDPSSAQSSIIFKKSVSEYYVFTTGAFGTGNLGYSIVNMSLSAGLGSVTSSYTLSSTVAEKLTATYHCNGSDVWFLAHKMGSNAFEAYLAGPGGVSTTPVISNIGAVYQNTYSAFGSMKFSPNGSKLAVVHIDVAPNPNSTIELYDFDVSTGLVSNYVLLGSYNDACHSVEFSPDGSKLYTAWRDLYSVIAPRHILQWDLCAASGSAIAASQSTVATLTTVNLRNLQTGPDGKIYFSSATTGSLPVLGCISSPNLAGASCNVTTGILTLKPGGSAGFGFPNYITNIFQQKPSFSHSVSCGSVSFTPKQFCTGAGYTVNGYKWLFGDPASGAANSSTLASPNHLYPGNGNYSVSLIVQYPCFTDTLVQVLNLNSLPSLSVAGKSSICNKEATTFTVSGANSYLWVGGQTTSTLAVNPATTTVYTVTGTNSNSCQSSKTVTLAVNPCTSLAEEANVVQHFRVYPNPGDGNFTVDLQINSTLLIYNSLGIKIKEIEIVEPNQKIDLTTFPSGIYTAKVKGNHKLKLLLFRE